MLFYLVSATEVNQGGLVRGAWTQTSPPSALS